MTKAEIESFLKRNADITKRIKRISVKYSLNDFVMVTDKIKDVWQNKTDLSPVYGCIADVRGKNLLLLSDRSFVRLSQEYMDFIREMIIMDCKDIVFYIVAYHYLSLCCQLGYRLTAADDAVFPYSSGQMTQYAKDSYEEYTNILLEGLHKLFRRITKYDLDYYNKIYLELERRSRRSGCYSIIGWLLDFDSIIDMYELEDKLKLLLDVFVFRYKVVYADMDLSRYPYSHIMLIDKLKNID